LTARVCQLITELDPGGAERIVYELATHLDAARFDVLVVSLQPATGAIAERLRERGVCVRSIEMRSKLDLGARKRLAALLREEHVDLLHTHLIHASYLGRRAARAGGVRAVVSTVHGYEERTKPWRSWADRRTAGLADAIVCVSRTLAGEVSKRLGVCDSTLRVICNGVDLARFAAPLERDGIRRALGVASDEYCLVSLGRLRRDKGHDLAIRSMREVLKDEKRARLLVVGDGPERARLSALVRELGLGRAVSLLGQRDDVPAILAAADGVVCASRSEGFGLAVAEAMAAGVPIVATRVGAIPEVLRDGEDGLLVPSEDPAALGAAVVGLMRDPSRAEALRARAQSRAEEEFSLERMIALHEELYEGLLKSARAAPAP
jgi:glycosyltransferase involved in cell wall biosynthesis